MAQRAQLDELSTRGAELLAGLPPADTGVESWVKTGTSTSEDAAYFDTHGFTVQRGFVDAEGCKAMIERMTSLVESSWHPGDKSQPSAVFRTDSEQVRGRGVGPSLGRERKRSPFFASNAAGERVWACVHMYVSVSLPLPTPFPRFP